jgi:hypothetical protein
MWHIKKPHKNDLHPTMKPVGLMERAVRKQLKNYERMKLLTERWIDLATELSALQLVKETG